MHHGHHGHHGGGGNAFWGGYLPWNRFGNYSSPVEVVYQTAPLPDWAIYAGLGLLALIALKGGR